MKHVITNKHKKIKSLLVYTDIMHVKYCTINLKKLLKSKNIGGKCNEESRNEQRKI